jgi:hypothetical protein
MCRFVGTMWSEIEESESEREEPINQTKISIKETEIVITDRARRKAEVEMGMGIANFKPIGPPPAKPLFIRLVSFSILSLWLYAIDEREVSTFGITPRCDQSF